MTASLGLGVLSFAHAHVSTYCGRIRAFDDARLVAAWDDDPARGARQAEAFGMAYSPHLQDVLERADVDCVMVGSETNKHADLCIAALAAGKSVFLQKPMATTLADCDRIIAAAERSGQWFSLAFQMRTDPQNIVMRDLVRAGAVGHVGTIRRRHCIPLLFSQSFIEGPTHWHTDPVANVGMFFDDATHALDWLVWMLDERPVSVMAEIGNVLTHAAPDDTGAAILRYSSGMFALIYNSSVTWAGENTTEIYGDRGVIIQNYGDNPSCAFKPPHPIAVKLYQRDKHALGWQDLGLAIPASHGERIAGVARPFIEALKAGQPLCTAQEGRLSVEMALACYASARTGRRVTFPYGGEALNL
ncbi:MAG: Gfo/Idh/MocA family oxidoreductase [Chloroflexota bacterium]